MSQRVTSHTIERVLPLADLSGLANADPGDGGIWWDVTSGALLVGAKGSFGLTSVEVNTLIAAYAAPLVHNHDALYFTEAEVTAALALKADLSGAAFTGNVSISGSGELYIDNNRYLYAKDSGGSYVAMMGMTAANAIQLRSAGGLQVRNPANNADAPVTCSTVTFSGQLLPSSTAQDIGSVSALIRHLYQRGDAINYNAGFSGSTNYERAYGRWATNVYTIGLESAGTGVSRPLQILSPASLTLRGTNVAFRNVGGTGDTPITTGAITVSGTIGRASGGLDLAAAASNWVTFYAGATTLFGVRPTYDMMCFSGVRIGFETGSSGIGDIYIGRSAANVLGVYANRSGLNSDLAGLVAAELNVNGAKLLSPKTFGTLPSAPANTGASLQITDRNYRWATSDGANWCWFGSTTVAT